MYSSSLIDRSKCFNCVTGGLNVNCKVHMLETGIKTMVHFVKLGHNYYNNSTSWCPHQPLTQKPGMDQYTLAGGDSGGLKFKKNSSWGNRIETSHSHDSPLNMMGEGGGGDGISRFGIRDTNSAPSYFSLLNLGVFFYNTTKPSAVVSTVHLYLRFLLVILSCYAPVPLSWIYSRTRMNGQFELVRVIIPGHSSNDNDNDNQFKQCSSRACSLGRPVQHFWTCSKRLCTQLIRIENM